MLERIQWVAPKKRMVQPTQHPRKLGIAWFQDENAIANVADS
ncbi:hypothetical protein [Nostoc sp. C052]|nr:hypothetical protein [Nostoc sp. C052]